MGISISSQGDFNKTKSDLKDLLNMPSTAELESWGQLGVDALASATPEDTRLTSESWGFRITKDSFGPVLEWYNTNVDDQGNQIAILLQYGHGTGTGGYVQGKDYINPAIQYVFDMIVQELGK
jgi:hypothetical protein